MFDATSLAGAAFGAAAARRGARVHASGSDIGRVWRDVLEPRLKTGPAAIAGLTAGAPLFCLELLARDYGLCAVYRIEHVPGSGGRVHHELTGPAELAGWRGALAAAGAQWADVAAVLAAAPSTERAPEAPLGLVDLAARPGRAQTLFTWRIAPPERSRQGCRSYGEI